MAKILLAEDEPSIRYLLKRFLTMAGHEVFIASSGREAYSMATRDVPDMVISDVQMRHGTGIWLLDELRKAGLDMHVILMTGNAGEDFDRVQALAVAGPEEKVSVLAKPIDISKVVALVAELLKETT